MTTSRERSERIAALNDELRRNPTGCGLSLIIMAVGVAALGSTFWAKVAAKLAALDIKDFDAGNDPYGERDFGAIYQGRDGRWICLPPAAGDAVETVFWKIDAYDRQLQFGSEDPANPAVTRRVLTIMLASEY